MRTTLNLDDDLIREAGRLTGLRAKTDVIKSIAILSPAPGVSARRR